MGSGRNATLLLGIVIGLAGCSRDNPLYNAQKGSGGSTSQETIGTMGTMGTRGVGPGTMDAGPGSADGNTDPIPTPDPGTTTETPTPAPEESSGGEEPEFSPCCEPGGRGCPADLEVQDCVCAVAPFCCGSSWDVNCVNVAVNECEIYCDFTCCGAIEEGCPKPMLEDCVCEMGGGLGQCCDGPWTEECAAAAITDCGACDMVGNCCDPDNGSPGCDNASIMACVCEFDDYCCSTEWDFMCIGVAMSMCAVMC